MKENPPNGTRMAKKLPGLYPFLALSKMKKKIPQSYLSFVSSSHPYKMSDYIVFNAAFTTKLMQSLVLTEVLADLWVTQLCVAFNHPLLSSVSLKRDIPLLPSYLHPCRNSSPVTIQAKGHCKFVNKFLTNSDVQ